MCWLNDPDIFISKNLFALNTRLLRAESTFKFLQIFWDAITFWDKVKFLGAKLLLHFVEISSKSVFKGKFS